MAGNTPNNNTMLKNDTSITSNSVVHNYLAIPLPDSDIARRNANGVVAILSNYFGYESYNQFDEGNNLSLWHSDNTFFLAASVIAMGQIDTCQAEIDALNAQIATLTAEIAELNAQKSITIYNYNAINRYGSVCFWVNHSGSIEILRIGDTAAIATGLRLCGDRLEANGNVILTGLSGWHYWQFRKSGGSLTAWINGVMAAGSTIAPAAMTAVLQLGGISTMTTSFDTSVIDPPPTRE
jgi:hypothetical protein